MSFQRFIHDDLGPGIEDVLTDINKFMKKALPLDIDTDTEVIDGIWMDSRVRRDLQRLFRLAFKRMQGIPGRDRRKDRGPSGQIKDVIHKKAPVTMTDVFS
jgi:hypothetical protein